MSKLKVISLTIAALIIVIQFFQTDKQNPAVDPQYSLFESDQIDSSVKEILLRSCSDCHSNRTVYPWYAYVAPMSWRISSHITHGRGELNFDEWGLYEVKKKKHKIEESIEELRENHMPLSSYLLFHDDAKLDAQQKDVLINWFQKEFDSITE